MSQFNLRPLGRVVSSGFVVRLGMAVTVFVSGLLPLPSFARQPANAKNTCNISAQKAAQKTGVPLAVLQAISLAETGRKTKGRMESWPWTVNMEGAGNWFESRADALDYAVRKYKRGARSFDIGCFQINYKWHGEAFSSIDQMFDPDSNALYAARYLLDLYREKGDWKSAAGAYHSRTPKYAKNYADRFARLYADLTDGGAVPTDQRQVKRNRYPLLQTPVSSSAATGSLVRIASGQGGGALISPPAARLF